MKVKELIAELQKLDQETEVTVGGKSIHFVETLPGFYDGYYEKLILEEGNIKGLEYTRSGNKVLINSFEVDDLIWNCDTEDELNNLIIKFDRSLSENQKLDIEKKIGSIKANFRNYLNKQNGK